MGNYSFLNLITAIYGFAIASVLVFSPVRNKYMNRFLGIGFFAIAYRSLSIFALQEQLVPNTYLMGSVSFVYYLIPPIFYLYLRRLADDERQFELSDFVHFIIPSLAFSLLLYYFLAGYISTDSWQLPIQETRLNDRAPFPFYVQMGHHVVVIFAMSVFYIILSWKVSIKRLTRRSDDHPQLKKMRKWQLTLLITFSLLTVVLFLGAILNWSLGVEFYSLNISNLNIVRSLILIYLFSRVIVKRDLLLGIPELKTKLPDVESLATIDPPLQLETIYETEIVPSEVPTVEEKEEDTSMHYFDNNGWIREKKIDTAESSGPSLEQDKVMQYIDIINEYLETKPYTDPEFDMKTLSNQLQIPHYHVEYLFRYYNKYTFPEFRNLLRVRQVLTDLESGTNSNYTVEAIGQQAGFSSRSSFFRVFKSITGKTPKQYLEDQSKVGQD